MTSRARDGLIAGLVTRAEAAAHAAGKLVLHRPAVMQIDSKSSLTDSVTEMDRASEALLVEMLLEGRGEDAILGEEGADRAGTSGVRWVIDPIDGTTNYIYRIPMWSVSVGIELDGDSVGGVVHVPAIGETYLARDGQGAIGRTPSGEQQLRVTDIKELSMALVATGFGYVGTRRNSQAAVVRETLPRMRDIRRTGCASMDLCWLAAGRLDAYYERGLKPWDLCAGGVIAREAGARIEGLNGQAAGEDLVIAANPDLFPALHDLLAELKAASG